MIYFTEFQLDTDQKELRQGNETVDLTKKTYDLLLYLVQNPQQVHSKETLIEHVWHGRTVSGNTIDQTISKLRNVLGQYSSQTYIESIYGQGIKWLPEVGLNSSKHTSNHKLLIYFFISFCVLGVVAYIWLQKKTTHSRSSAAIIGFISTE